MTTGEARMLGRLFFGDDKGETLIQVYGDVFGEALDLEGDGGRVPADLSVSLARLATNIDAVVRLGKNQLKMMLRIRESKGCFTPGVEDWAEIYDELTEICIRPSLCLDSADQRTRFLMLKTALIRKVSPLAAFAGYDEAQFSEAIQKAQRRVRGEA